MQSYSQDLRDRVLWALDRGERPTAIARRLEVSRVWVYQVRGREQKTGQRSSFQIGGHRRSRIAEMEPVLRAWIEQAPGLSLARVSRTSRRAGHLDQDRRLVASVEQMGSYLQKKPCTPASKNARTCSGRAERGMQALPTMEVEKLVFIDETWISTSMTRRYGRAPRGQRCLDSAPHGHWETTTFVGALRRRRLTAPMVTDGPMDGETFLAYVHQFLCPTLQPGDTVILDNLSSHKVAGVEKAITATGATVLYLPPYSPDLNPIEKFFSKLKALLRKAAKRDIDALWKEIGDLLNTVSPSECTNYFASCGYVNT